MCQELHDEAKALLSGNTSERSLRAMGNPYGRRAGINGAIGRQRRKNGSKGVMPAMPINKHSGKLLRALRMQSRNQGEQQIYVLSVDKSLRYAKYILGTSGTKRMVTRPFWARLHKAWRKRNFELLVKMRGQQLNAV